MTVLLGTVEVGEASAGDQAMQGFERELAEALCGKMQTRCSFASADRDEAIEELLAGEADIALAALVHAPALAAKVALTLPYAMPRHGFAVASAGALPELPGTGKTPSFIVTPQMSEAAVAELRGAFQGRALGAAAGSADLEFLTRYFGDSATIRSYPGTDAAVAALLDGEVSAVMAPITDLAATGQRPGFQAVRRSGPEFGEDELLGRGYAAAVQPSDTALRDRVNRALDRLILDGSLRKLSLRWFALDVTPQRCGCKPF